MINFAKARAIQQLRYINPSEEARHDRAKPKRNPRRLQDLLTALAGRMAALGMVTRDGKRRPASPAY